MRGIVMFKNSAQEGITSQQIALTLNKKIKKCERPDFHYRGKAMYYAYGLLSSEFKSGMIRICF
jgi:hypothetical protein